VGNVAVPANRPAGRVGGNFDPLQPNMKSGDPSEESCRRARLMADAQRGDADAYGELLNELGPMVMRFVRRHVRDADDAQDLYQEVFMSVHRARHTYDPARPLEPWLFAIARRVVSDHKRRRLARQAHEVLVEVLPERSIEADGHLKPRLEQALRGLSFGQREAVELLRLDGLPTAAAARVAGTTVGALKVRAHRAYKVLRELL
jgi:RNA polymerase sigma-70 factor (ECF subfamily)